MLKRTNRSVLIWAAERLRASSVVVILLGILGVLALLVPQFLTTNNLLTVALQTSIIALVAVGMAFTLITGGVDLSVGSVAALCGALAAGLAVRQQIGSYPAILIALAAGVALGAISGALIVWGRLPPFVATLAIMAAARGLTLVYTQGRPIAGLDQQFVFWGTGDLWGLPMPVIVMAIVVLAAHILLTQTAFGLHVYAVGGGEGLARLASVRTERVTLGVYMLSGLCAALTGVLLTACLWSAQPNSGVGIELDALAAAVLGGTSLTGGVGGVGGTLAGAFIS
jgi:ribose transport system permease protein